MLQPHIFSPSNALRTSTSRQPCEIITLGAPITTTIENKCAPSPRRRVLIDSGGESAWRWCSLFRRPEKGVGSIKFSLGSEPGKRVGRARFRFQFAPLRGCFVRLDFSQEIASEEALYSCNFMWKWLVLAINGDLRERRTTSNIGTISPFNTQCYWNFVFLLLFITTI